MKILESFVKTKTDFRDEYRGLNLEGRRQLRHAIMASNNWTGNNHVTMVLSGKRCVNNKVKYEILGLIEELKKDYSIKK
jgi:hypothetical protein